MACADSQGLSAAGGPSDAFPVDENVLPPVEDFHRPRRDEDLALDANRQGPKTILWHLGLKRFAAVGLQFDPHVGTCRMDPLDYGREGRVAVPLRFDFEVVRTNENSHELRG